MKGKELKKDEGKLIKTDLTRAEYLSPELREKHNLPDKGLVISELRRYESNMFTDDESAFLENLWGKPEKESINEFDSIKNDFKGLLTKREDEARREERINNGKDIVQDIGTFECNFQREPKCDCKKCKFIRLYQGELNRHIKKLEELQP